jgi:hypothetical protein
MAGGAWLGWVQRRSGWILVGAGLLAALAFPTTGAGGAGMLIVVGALGVAIADHGGKLPLGVRQPPPGVTGAIAVGVVVVAGAAVFGRLLDDSPGWTMGDWGIQHAVLREVIDGIKDGDLPVWSHALSTGDAPLETYPAITYLVAGTGAIVTGMEDDLPRYLLCFAAAVHILVAVGITRLCLRVAPAPIAAIAGVTQLLDYGNISAGGIAGNIEWALVHSAFGQALLLFGAVSALDAIARPRLRTSVSIWLWFALASATHPAALLTAGAVMVALAASAVIAADAPARRGLVAAGHIAIGITLGSVVWLPLGERLVLYGQHFPSAARAPSELFTNLLTWPVPATTFAPVMYAGLAGIVAGVASRRALPAAIGAAGCLLVLGMIDLTYLVLDVGPSRSLSRLGAERFHSMCRPFVVAGAAYVVAVAVRAIARRWRGAGPGRRRVGAALVAVLAGLTLRACVPWAAERSGSAGTEAQRAADARGEGGLVAWAHQQVAAQAPGTYARALFDLGDVHYNFHLTAETGLPTFHTGAIPNLLLRERIEDTSPASLRRFNVRWVVVSDDRVLSNDPDRALTAVEERAQDTLALGDPETELRFGRSVVREIADWDGAFARIEAGAGAVRVVRLEAEAVEVELTGTDQPALVALGLGFSPRWRARDATGRAVPVYALPTIEDGELHVVAAWVRPGRTLFTPDAELPSDGAGRGRAALAALVALAGIVGWSRPRWKWRVLRRVARVRAWAAARRRAIIGGVVAVIALALPIAGAMRACGPAHGLHVGAGLRGVATVYARSAGSDWAECGYSRVEGRYVCGGIAAVSDSIAGVVNDAQELWPFTTPSIHMEPLSGSIADVRVELDADLDGPYWVGSTGGSTSLQIGDAPAMDVRHTRELGLAGRGRAPVTIRATVSGRGTWFTLVRRDAIDPDRPFLVHPPPAPP